METSGVDFNWMVYSLSKDAYPASSSDRVHYISQLTYNAKDGQKSAQLLQCYAHLKEIIVETKDFELLLGKLLPDGRLSVSILYSKHI